MNRRLALVPFLIVFAACAPADEAWWWELELSGLPALDEGRYAAWVEDDDGGAVQLFEFTDGEGVYRELLPVDPADFSSLAVSIHPSDGQLTGPSAAVVLASDEIGDNVFFDTDLPQSGLTGIASLWTPTDGTPDDATAGIWFGVADEDGETVPSLTVPVLGDGWRWESWVETQDMSLSMGRFSSPAGADDGCPYCDDVAPVPMVPGEDFLVDLPDGLDTVDLADGGSRCWVSLEPDLDGVDPTGDGSWITALSVTLGSDLEGGDAVDFGPDMPGIFGTMRVLGELYEG